MPASVAAWIETHDYQQSLAEQDDIQQTYYDDFVKYKDKLDPKLLRNTLQSVVIQIGKKFSYSNVEGGYKPDDVKKALSMLCDAGIIKRVSHTAANGLPFGAEVNDKFRKYIFLDSGLLLRILDIDFGRATEITDLILAGTAENLVNKGGLAEMVLGWEMVKYSKSSAQHDLYYWENLDRGTTSEVDYVIAKELKVVPVEVKANVSGKMKSLRVFMNKKHLIEAYRCSLENFSCVEYSDENDGNVVRKIMINPLYAVSNFIK